MRKERSTDPLLARQYRRDKRLYGTIAATEIGTGLVIGEIMNVKSPMVALVLLLGMANLAAYEVYRKRYEPIKKSTRPTP